MMFEGFYGPKITITPLCFHPLFLLFQHMLSYQRPLLLEVETRDLSKFLFSL